MKCVNKERHAARMQYFIGLLGGVCNRCKSTEQLEFDHIDPNTKEFNISKKVRCRDSVVLSELTKCQLLCKKCHDEKTLTEDGEKYKSQHGMRSMYLHHKCRCVLCRNAHNDYMREYKRCKNAKV